MARTARGEAASSSEFDDRIDRAMNRCADGDDAAFREVYELMGRRLMAYFLRQGASQAVAEDLLQDVAMRLYRARGNYQRGASAMAWAYGIAKNAHIDHLRAQRTRRNVGSDEGAMLRAKAGEDTSGEAVVTAAEQARHLSAAIAALPAAQREAFELRQVQGLDVATAARKAGVSENAFKIRVHRAKAALREALDRFTDEEGPSDEGKFDETREGDDRRGP